MLQLEHQIKYKKLKIQYFKNLKNLNKIKRIIEEAKINNYNETQVREIRQDIITIENTIIELSKSLILQQEKADSAHR